MTQFTIYGRPNCAFCDQAKRLAESEGWDFTYHDVMADPDARKTLMEIAPGARTVPQIFLGDRHLGGYTELAGLYKSGVLATLMETTDDS